MVTALRATAGATSRRLTMASDEEPTFDIGLEDATVDDLVALMSGLTREQAQAARAATVTGDDERLEHLKALAVRLLTENPEAARYLMLESELADDTVIDLPPDVFAELGVTKVGGELHDAEEFTDIEVE